MVRLSRNLHSHTYRKCTSSLRQPPFPAMWLCPQYQTISRLWRWVPYVSCQNTGSVLHWEGTNGTGKMAWQCLLNTGKGGGDNILLCKVFRHYQTLERVWILCSKSKHCILLPSIWYSSLSILLSPWDYWLETDTLDHFWDLRFHYSATTLTNYKFFAKYPMFSLAESPQLMGW